MKGIGARPAILAVTCAAALAVVRADPAIEFKPDAARGRMQILIGGRETLVYVFGPNVDLPHFHPLRSPSGQSMTVQQTNPFPHHRSFWFADTVQLAGQEKPVSFYNAYYSGAGDKPNRTNSLSQRERDGVREKSAPGNTTSSQSDPALSLKEERGSPFRDQIRHVAFGEQKSGEGEGTIEIKLRWEADHGKTPVLDETRRLRIVALGGGEYFLDLRFTLTANYSDATFRSDAVHYAWPFIRLNDDFNTNGGGRLVNSAGQTGQTNTNMKVARWVDFSRAGRDQPEGLALFSHPSNEHPHAWLTRDYGCFGPRRVDAKSGKPFTLKRGESISTRVGVLVHKGDVKSGHVAERYQAYADGNF